MENNMPASLIVRDIAVTVEGIGMNMTVGTKDEVAKVLSEFKKMDRFLFADTTSINETESEIGEKQFSVNITLIYAPIINEETVEE